MMLTQCVSIDRQFFLGLVTHSLSLSLLPPPLSARGDGSIGARLIGSPPLFPFPPFHFQMWFGDWGESLSHSFLTIPPALNVSVNPQKVSVFAVFYLYHKDTTSIINKGLLLSFSSSSGDSIEFCLNSHLQRGREGGINPLSLPIDVKMESMEEIEERSGVVVVGRDL